MCATFLSMVRPFLNHQHTILLAKSVLKYNRNEIFRFALTAVEATIMGTTYYHRNKEACTVTAFDNKALDNNLS